MALVGAACSGEEEAAPSTVPVTVATTVPATVATVATTVPVTVPPVTTQPPPTTSAPPTTVPSTSAVAPTTTTPVISSTPATLSPLNETLLPTLETALPAVLADYSTALVEAARAPADPGRREALRSLTGPDLYGRFEATLDSWVAAGRFQRERPGMPPRAEPRLFTTGMSADEPIAVMEACVVASDFVIEVGPDGAETVTDAEIDSSVNSYVFEFTDDRWVIVDFSVIESFAGTEGCAS
jgi:hypothetical protein